MSELSIRAAAREVPEAVALIDEHGELTFAALAELAGAAVEDLHGALVLIAPRPTREDVATLLGMLDQQIPFALANPSWSPVELQDAADRTGASTVITRGERHRALGRRESSASDTVSHAVSHAASDFAVLVFTSGSSGRAKIVQLTSDALLAAAAAHALALPWQQGDAWVLSLPLGHIGGLCVLTRSLYARRPVVLVGDRFDAASLVQQLSRHRGTLLSLVPTMMQRILRADAPPPPSLRAILLGGAAAGASLIQEARDAGWPVLPTYGMSETCAQVCTQRLDDLAPTGVGPPLPGVSLRVRDGEIEVSGPTLMSGYLDEPACASLEWHRTGDLGRFDERGHLHVIGRADARIITGGENVDPVEVEAALLAHPQICEAFVFGRPDEHWGQAVNALIVVSSDVTFEELGAFLAPRLAGFKRPKHFRRVERLPHLESGKVDRVAAERSVLPECSVPPDV